ncbi:hypothetical protein RND81_14G132000 [Saponaria officinalis]|uniref:Transmembrane protein n=1 Tax=Saponaria officinalis TaxID=3572 RepID=A0AAW1GTI3_SAPOF
MKLNNKINVKTLLIMICILCFVANLQIGVAIRPLFRGENMLRKNNALLFELLPKGSGTGSGSNPCTFIPGGTGHC